MALTFDGTGDYARATSVANLDNAQYTMACWVYQSGSAISVIVAAGTAANPRIAALLRANPASSGWRVRLEHNWSSNDPWWRYDTDLALNTWYHVAWAYNRASSGNDPALYVNGAAVGALTETGPPSGTADSGADQVMVGASDTTPLLPYTGRVAEIGMWSRILSAAEIQAVYRLSPLAAPTGLEWYAPCLRTGVERMQGAALTLAGDAGPAEHPPRVIYPRSSRVIVSPPAAAESGSTPKIFRRSRGRGRGFILGGNRFEPLPKL